MPTFHSRASTRRATAAAAAFLTAVGIASASAAEWPSAAPMPRDEGWLVPSLAALQSPPPPANPAAELTELRALAGKRTGADIDRILWWDTGGPAYRWNEIAVDALLEQFVTQPLASRHLALIHTAIDDAVAAAWHNKSAHRRPRPSQVDASLNAALPVPASPSYPSDFAAAAAAASEVLGALFPERADMFAAKAEEAMQSRLLAGVEFPSDAAAGQALGQQVAALALARAKTDGSDAKWSGSVPQGAGKWQGTNPAAPMAGTWRSWMLSRPDEFRSPPPPDIQSEAVKAALAELKDFKRTPKTNHTAVYWEVFGGARVHALWNEVTRTKLLEHGAAFDAPASARALAAVNVALADSAIACWEAKYAYWYIRPSQHDPELKPVFPPPAHPSYPSAHSCLSTAATTVLAALFPRDAERLMAIGKEASEARIWAGIHYRFDIDAGQTIGRQVGERVLARALANQAQ